MLAMLQERYEESWAQGKWQVGACSKALHDQAAFANVQTPRPMAYDSGVQQDIMNELQQHRLMLDDAAEESVKTLGHSLSGRLGQQQNHALQGSLCHHA